MGAAPFKNAVNWASRAKGGHGMAGKVVGIMGAGGGRGTALAQMHFRQTAVFFGLRVVNKPEVMVNAFEQDAEGNFANVNLKNGDLVNDKLKARVGICSVLCAKMLIWLPQELNSECAS